MNCRNHLKLMKIAKVYRESPEIHCTHFRNFWKSILTYCTYIIIYINIHVFRLNTVIQFPPYSFSKKLSEVLLGGIDADLCDQSLAKRLFKEGKSHSHTHRDFDGGDYLWNNYTSSFLADGGNVLDWFRHIPHSLKLSLTSSMIIRIFAHFSLEFLWHSAF